MLPCLLVTAAAIADAHGSHGLAFDALLAAVPFAAVAALAGFGEYLEARDDTLAAAQSFLWALVLALLVLSCAARSPATQTHTLPPLGRSALVGCLALLAVKGVLAAAPYVRRLALSPAKP